jgi:hypothetical protein
MARALAIGSATVTRGTQAATLKNPFFIVGCVSFEYAKVQIFQLTPKKFAYYGKNELLCTLF